ncbi:hypothetical protein MRB53_018192 [Persea americana]|uniref:Uncharacterized protein n=1 Tax=Persea americana TaxID=3435 RepID=A0ACC2M7D8_PERAE|nr:hypothetical protein MRB53_018192 [Persea americana]
MKVARVYTRKKRAADITWSTQETKNPDEKVNVEKVRATSYTRSFFYGGREGESDAGEGSDRMPIQLQNPEYHRAEEASSSTH